MTITPEKLKQLRAVESSGHYHAFTSLLQQSADALLTIAEREQGLIEALHGCRQQLAYLGRVFCGPNFTDRGGDGARCKRLVQKADSALATVGEYPQPS